MNKKTQLRKQINEAKIRIAVAKESKKPSFPSTGVGILIESELDKASLLLSAEAITDRLTDMAEKVAKIEPDELMKMDAALKAQVGDEAAARFYSKTVEALRTLLDQIKVARDMVGVEIKGLKDGQIPNDMANQEPEALAPQDGTADAGMAPDDMGPAPAEDGDDLANDIDPKAYNDEAPAEPDIDPEPALGRERKDSPLKESRNPDAIVLESFIAQMRKSGNALTSARIVAERFDIDVSDVKDIVKEAALAEKKKLPKGFVPFKKKSEKKDDVKEGDEVLAEKKKLPKGFVPFKKKGEKEDVKEADDECGADDITESKKKGIDGKECWKGYKYAGTEDGKDKCVPVKRKVAESTEALSFEEWCKKVEEEGERRLCISFNSLHEPDEMRRYYQGYESEDGVGEFITWYRDKYDLTEYDNTKPYDGQ